MFVPFQPYDPHMLIQSRTKMNELLAAVLDAHGGVDRWRRYENVEAQIVSGGGFSRLRACCKTRTRDA